MKRWAVSAFLLASVVVDPTTIAEAQRVNVALGSKGAMSSVEDAVFYKKQRRLNIAGWTLVGTGIAFPVAMGIARATRDTSARCGDPIECPLWPVSVTSFVLGPVMAVVGGGLLIRRKRLQSKHQEQQGLLISPGLTGLSVSGRF